MRSLQNIMFSSYIIAAFFGSWTSCSFSKDPKAFYKHFQHTAKCKIAPGKKKKKEETILFAAFPLIFATSSCGLVAGALSLDVKRGSGLRFCKGFLDLLPKTTTRKFSSATLLSADNSGSNPWLMRSQEEPNPITPKPPTAITGWQTHRRSHFSHYKCASAFPAPPPGTSLMAHEWHCLQSCTAPRTTIIWVVIQPNVHTLTLGTTHVCRASTHLHPPQWWISVGKRGKCGI